MLIPGAYALAHHGQCVMPPMRPVTVGPAIYAGVPAGAPRLTLGVLRIGSGIATISLPGNARMIERRNGS